MEQQQTISLRNMVVIGIVGESESWIIWYLYVPAVVRLKDFYSVAKFTLECPNEKIPQTHLLVQKTKPCHIGHYAVDYCTVFTVMLPST
jgi:hypothetical protein